MIAVQARQSIRGDEVPLAEAAKNPLVRGVVVWSR